VGDRANPDLAAGQVVSDAGRADALIARLLISVVVQQLEERRRPLQSRQTSNGIDGLLIRGIAMEVGPKREILPGLLSREGVC